MFELDRPTIDSMVLDSTRRFRDHTALERLDARGRRVGFTYGELGKRIDLVARGLRADGVRPGDRVAIMGANSPSWALGALSALAAGAVLVPVDQKATRHELARALEHSGATRLLVTGAAFERLEALPRVERVYFLDRSRTGARFRGLDNLASDGVHLPALEGSGRVADDLAMILYTSGTTGDPKGVMLTHWNIVSNVQMILNRLPADERDAFTSVLPLSHTLEFTGGLMVPLAVGASVHYVGSYNPAEILKTMSTCGGTIMIGVPRLYQAMARKLRTRFAELTGARRAAAEVFRLVARRARGLGRMLFREVHERFGGRTRFWVSGGAPLDPQVVETFADVGIALVNGYGLTETAPVLTCNPVEGNRAGTVGSPLPGVEVKIFDADHSGVGEVAVRGPNVFRGYFRNKAATRAAFRDGWFLTGDLGKLAPDGKLELSGRSKSVIVTPGGKNVYPEEVEEVLARSPLFAEVAVVGTPASETDAGEVVTAVVVPSEALLARGGDPEAVALREVRARARELSDAKRPRRVVLRADGLPRTHSMKVRRAALGAQVAASAARPGLFAVGASGPGGPDAA